MATVTSLSLPRFLSLARAAELIARTLSRAFDMTEQQNIEFVKEIEKHPCIYNKRLMEYARKDLSEKAWKEVGAKFNMSVSQCKDRWKNFRNTLTRTLKQSSGSSPKTKKPYYLTEAMQFAIPFLRSQNVARSAQNYEIVAFESPSANHESAEIEIQECMSEIKQEDTMAYDAYTQSRTPSPWSETSLQANLHQHSSSQLCSPQTPSLAFQLGIKNSRKSTDTNEKGEKDEDQIQRKKARIENATSTDLTKLSRKRFLFSLLSDVYSMDDAQMRSFRIKVLNLIDDIVQTPSTSTST